MTALFEILAAVAVVAASLFALYHTVRVFPKSSSLYKKLLYFAVVNEIFVIVTTIAAVAVMLKRSP
jgi:hypothetical protein